MDRGRPRGIAIVALLMVVFGVAEVITGFTHDFFGLRTIHGAVSASMGAGIGVCYAMAGLFVLTMKRRAAAIAMVLLVVVVGRVSMVVTGLYPVESCMQAIAMVLGTVIAAGFAFYIYARRSAFS